MTWDNVSKRVKKYGGVRNVPRRSLAGKDRKRLNRLKKQMSAAIEVLVDEASQKGSWDGGKTPETTTEQVDLDGMNKEQLRAEARRVGLKGYSKLTVADLRAALAERSVSA